MSSGSIKQPGLPLLKPYNHKVTSPRTNEYNCIAWAAGENDVWWWPDPALQYYWPHSIPREATIDAFVQAYASIGYVECDDNDVEKGYEKIAIYAKNGTPTHAARQLKSGRWTSKLGGLEDIEHEIGGVEGPDYGQVAKYMKRKRQS